MRCLFLISSILMMLFASTVSATEPARSLEGFDEKINKIFSSGGDYEGFYEVVDPRGELKGGIKKMISYISTQTNGSPLKYVEMFRRHETQRGAKVIGVLLGEENEVMLYLAFVLLKRDGIWGAVSINAQSNFTNLPAVYH